MEWILVLILEPTFTSNGFTKEIPMTQEQCIKSIETMKFNGREGISYCVPKQKENK